MGRGGVGRLFMLNGRGEDVYSSFGGSRGGALGGRF